MNELCDVCGEPATGRILTNMYEGLGPLELQGDLIATAFNGSRGIFSGERVDATLCEAHYAHAMDGITDADGVASGQRLVSPADSCDDAFHSGGDDGEEYEVNFGGGLLGIGYRCPSCGFQTLSRI